MELFLGIDIGGTNVKMATVSKKGKLGPKFKKPTRMLCEEGNGDFVGAFIDLLEDRFDEIPEVKKIGIGVPGMLSKDRETVKEVANIPEMNGEHFLKRLRKAFPKKKFYLENDAAAAALGELKFGKKKVPEDFIFLTLGTGIGGGLVLDGKIFKGGKGNSMEIGHIISSQGKGLELSIGKKGLLEFGNKVIVQKNTQSQGVILEPFRNFDQIEEGALEGNEVALVVFHHFGRILGEGIVSVVRLLDVNAVLLGGGVSKCYHILREETLKTLKDHLPDYYLDGFILEKASLGNKAGILGAASLCF